MRISQDEMMMRMAEVAAQRGTCSRLRVGVVISRNGRVMSTGYNGAPARTAHCVHEDDSPCEVSVHAEANAVAWAARHGIRTEGADMFVTHQPCLKCAQLIVNAGIGRVVYLADYRLVDGVKLMRAAGIAVLRHQR